MHPLRRLSISLLRFVIGVYLGACLYGCAVVNQSLFPVPYPPGYEDGPGIIKLASTDDHLISARYFPVNEAPFVVLYCHGNGEDLGNVDGRAWMINKMGYSFMALDYQGYGTSEGIPREKHTFDDVRAAYDWLVDEKGIPPEQIVGHGFSLGGSVILDLAAQNPFGGLILESTFVSAFRVVTHYPLLPFDKYRNLGKIDNITCPVLLMHGEQDRIVHAWHGKHLYKKAPNPKFFKWFEQASHNDMGAQTAYTPTIQRFLAGLETGNWGDLEGEKAPKNLNKD